MNRDRINAQFYRVVLLEDHLLSASAAPWQRFECSAYTRHETMIALTVNGKTHALGLDPETPLLWALRDHLGLLGTKYGCGVGRCGICTVLIDGEPNHACMVSLARVGARIVTTIEGLPADHPVKQAWIAEQVPQCGYCQPGQILAATALLARHPHPSRAEINDAMSSVYCRCGTYPRICRAIERASGQDDSTPAVTASRMPLLLPFSELKDAVALNDWVRILPNGEIVLIIDRSEMGQGATTALATLLAEELEVDLDQVRVSFAPVDPVYNNRLWGEQFTGGSSAVRGEWEWLRQQGAYARVMLCAAAAKRFSVKLDECQAHRGEVLHPPSGKRASYGALAPAAAKLKPPKSVTLKNAEDFRLVGKALPRIEIPDMVEGRATYGLDVHLPGMLTASVLRCPVFGGRIAHVDDVATRAIPGVRNVIEIDAGAAVVADDAWSALRGREALRVRWHEGANAVLDNEKLRASLTAAFGKKGKTVRDDGKAERILKTAARVVEAQYETPYLAHATLEPMNCVAQVRAERCDVWVGTQSQVDTQKTAAKLTGLARGKVHVHTLYLGGGFGRRLETDFVADAVQLAKRAGAPVRVIWTRADDMQHDKYRPAHAARLRAALADDGLPKALVLDIAGPDLALDGINLPYAIANVRETHHEVESPIPTGPWRSVGASNNAFVIEGFIDELACAAGRDPLAFRLDLLRDRPRHQAVLELAATKSGWGTPLPAGHGRGIAAYHSFGSVVAQITEVAVTPERQIRVARVVCAIDCGSVVNPDTVRAQIEGGIILGLSAALMEEVRIERGRVLQSSFADYPILSLRDTPDIEVHILPSTDKPGGVGEPGVPVIAPAVANAVFAATGRRLRRLPLRL